MKKINKILNISGAIIILAFILGGLLNAWGANFKPIHIAWLSYIWIPVAILVWKDKI